MYCDLYGEIDVLYMAVEIENKPTPKSPFLIPLPQTPNPNPKMGHGSLGNTKFHL